MRPGITIRQALPADLDRITEIENLSFEADRFSRRQFSYLLRHAKGAFYVAESEGKVAGYISLLNHPRRGNIRIYAIAVDPGYRRKGVAGALVDQAGEYALCQGKNWLTLEVRTDNAPAIRLYEKNGFTVDSLEISYYTDGTDAYRMKRIL